MFKRREVKKNEVAGHANWRRRLWIAAVLCRFWMAVARSRTVEDRHALSPFHAVGGRHNSTRRRRGRREARSFCVLAGLPISDWQNSIISLRISAPSASLRSAGDQFFCMVPARTLSRHEMTHGPTGVPGWRRMRSANAGRTCPCSALTVS